LAPTAIHVSHFVAGTEETAVLRGLTDRPNVAVRDFDGERFQALAFAWTLDAEAGQGFIEGVVIVANEVLSVLGEKTAIKKIQAYGQMPAAVFVGDKLALKAREEAFERAAVARDGKFYGFTFRDFVSAGDFDFGHGRKV
jgi:hypothetical protein